MGMASYAVTELGREWTVLHDGEAEGHFETKEAAFEAALAAASLAIRQGHEVHVSAPGNEAGNKTALGGRTN
jgi:phosphotransferase system HPr-like phosphotransfer protein